MQDPELFELLQDAGSLGALAATLSTHWLDGTATDHPGRSEGYEGARTGAAIVPPLAQHRVGHPAQDLRDEAKQRVGLVAPVKDRLISAASVRLEAGGRHGLAPGHRILRDDARELVTPGTGDAESCFLKPGLGVR